MITLPVIPIIGSYFNKNLMSWELISFLLMYPSDSVMKSI